MVEEGDRLLCNESEMIAMHLASCLAGNAGVNAILSWKIPFALNKARTLSASDLVVECSHLCLVFRVGEFWFHLPET